ncbi:unnamed protein product [Calicophoron daubneyi]|uniref:Uncharacterized protein n=1 Tax=Calicophoron daubneyi TaxID=300641 RepID=A0AAV2T9L3_CALDB
MTMNYWHRAHLSGWVLAILSGFLAACAALWAKSLDKVSKYAAQHQSELNPHLALMIGYAFYVLINVLMWIVFGAALKKNGKCITTLALNTLSNFMFSVRGLASQ